MKWSEGHRRLKQWLERSGWTVVMLAEISDVGQTTIHHLLHGRRDASLRTALALQRATKGYVHVNHWVEDPKEDA